MAEDKNEYTVIGGDYRPTGSIKILPEQLVGFCHKCPGVIIPGSHFKSVGDLAWLSCPCCGGRLRWRREPQESSMDTSEAAPDF